MRHQSIFWALGGSFALSGAAVAQTTTPTPAPTDAATPTASAPDDPVQAMFDKADANRDGVLTLEEWKAAGRREQGFQMIDADHDSKVTLVEIRAAISKRNGG